MKATLVLVGALAVVLLCMSPAWAAGPLVLSGQDEPVAAITFAPDGARLYAGDETGHVRIWDAQTGKQIGAFAAHQGAIHSIVVSANGKGIVTAGADNAVKVWSTKTGENLRSFAPDPPELSFEDKMTGARQDSSKGAGGAAFSGDTRYIVSGHWDFRVFVWDLKTGSFKRLGPEDVPARLAGKAHSQAVTAVAFSPDGALVASGEEGTTYRGVIDAQPTTWGRLMIWNAQTGALIQSINPKCGVVSLAFLPDNKTLVSALSNGSVSVWDARKGKLNRSFAHGGGLRSMSLATDGSRIASASPEVVKIWEIAGGGVKAVKPPANSECTTLALSPDGKRIAIGLESGVIHLLDVGAIQGADLWDETAPGGVKPQDKTTAPPKKPQEDIWDEKPDTAPPTPPAPEPKKNPLDAPKKNPLEDNG